MLASALRGYDCGLLAFTRQGLDYGLLAFAIQGFEYGLLAFPLQGLDYGLLAFALQGSGCDYWLSPTGLRLWFAGLCPTGLTLWLDGYALRAFDRSMLASARRGLSCCLVDMPYGALLVVC